MDLRCLLSVTLPDSSAYTFKINLEGRRIYWAPSVVDWESQTFTGYL